eukprot:6460496-Amphidinium_carterae.3
MRVVYWHTTQNRVNGSENIADDKLKLMALDFSITDKIMKGVDIEEDKRLNENNFICAWFAE